MPCSKSSKLEMRLLEKRLALKAQTSKCPCLELDTLPNVHAHADKGDHALICALPKRTIIPTHGAALSKLLVLELALELLGLGHFSHSLVKIVLVDGVPVVFDGKQAAGIVSLFLARERRAPTPR